VIAVNESEEFDMKILLAIDGSNCSEAAVNTIAGRPWPEGSELKIREPSVNTLPILGATPATSLSPRRSKRLALFASLASFAVRDAS
jgi:hypothetical protein